MWPALLPLPPLHYQTPRQAWILQNELIEPAVKGTLNVLKASAEAKVKRVIIVSSGSAVVRNPNWPKDLVMDETCCSDEEHCRTTENWYSLHKTEAESEAWEYAKRTGLDVVAICLTLILGPILQSTVKCKFMCISDDFKMKYCSDGCNSLENRLWLIVDARDVVEEQVLAYETPEAKGRYICMAHAIKVKDLVEKLRSTYPNYNYPKRSSLRN
ncbi:hypothetical protein Peur_009584 [Populus x canadensis]